ncbi:MAG: alpha/beta hydrolase [Deltaproteobacteria bacterium]|nr:alpha/beta hydrolase [Deltaproteobacteria bacterium]
MAWIFLLATLVGAALTYNAYRPAFAPPRLAALSFFAGWLTTELALHHLAWQALAALVFIRLGALQAWPGKLGLLIALVSWVGLWRCYWRAGEAEAVVERGLAAGLGADYRERILPEVRAQFAPTVDWRQILLPFPMRHPEVERLRDLQFARVAGLNLKLDIYRHRSQPSSCPTLLQIHGGGWVIGSKNEQAIPLMLHMAARGWVCVTVNYRLSPHATFPDHLVDLKLAIQWIREHGREYGANPDFLVVTGGSAGGHLSALVALTGNQPEYQPGFETVDTAVQACVPFYGVYDFTDRGGFWRHHAIARLLERQVMKAARHEAPEAYEKASPMSLVHPGAPPFFVIHGDLDTLVPVEEARHFCELLRQTSQAPVIYAEIPGAQHAFEIFPSLRTTFVVHGVERFLAYTYSQYLSAQDQRRASNSQLAATA